MSRPRIQAIDFALSVELVLRPEVYEQRFGMTPESVGGFLADQVSAYVWREKGGYYPPLEFFRGREEVDPELIGMAEEMAWFAEDWCRVEIRRRVTQAFSRLAVRNVQTIAFTMPRVRPRQPNAQHLLARHYAPDTLRVELLASSLERGEFEGLERLAAHKVSRWLRDSVVEIEIPAVRRV